MGFAILSVVCSFLVFLTGWLVLPIFVLLPLSLYFAAKCYKETITRVPKPHILIRLLAMTPILIALLSVPLTLLFINANYQA